MNEMSMLNEPVSLTLAGEQVRLRLLSTARRRAIAQAWLLGVLIQEVKDKAAALYPDPADADKRAEFVRAGVERLPSGAALADEMAKVDDRTELLIKCLVAASVDPMPEQQAEHLLLTATRDEVAALLSFLYRYGRRVWLPSSVWDRAIQVMAQKYGYTPEDVAGFMDVVLLAMLPELTAGDAEAKKQAAIGKAVELWNKEHPNGPAPDFFNDIPPLLIRIANEEQAKARGENA